MKDKTKKELLFKEFNETNALYRMRIDTQLAFSMFFGLLASICQPPMSRLTIRELVNAIAEYQKEILKYPLPGKINSRYSNEYKKLYKVELDIVCNEDTYECENLATVLKSIRFNYGLACRIIQESGPGGGWPEVELIGTKEAIDKYLDVYTDRNRDGFEFAIEEVID